MAVMGAVTVADAAAMEMVVVVAETQTAVA